MIGGKIVIRTSDGFWRGSLFQKNGVTYALADNIPGAQPFFPDRISLDPGLLEEIQDDRFDGSVYRYLAVVHIPRKLGMMTQQVG